MKNMNSANAKRAEDMGGDFAEYVLAINECGGLRAAIEAQDAWYSKLQAELTKLTDAANALNASDVPEGIKAQVNDGVAVQVSEILARMEMVRVNKINLNNLADAGLIR